jgi:glutathione S-transferase
MANYISVQQARNMPGLRVVVPPAPGPWAEAAKSILYVKKLPFTLVLHEVGKPNLDLKQWTAQTSSPVIAWNDERPRSTWIEQLYLAERLAPEPPLIPASIQDRVLMFGMCNELMGETGLVWSLRVLRVQVGLKNYPKLKEQARAMVDLLAGKYQHGTPDEAQRASRRAAEIVAMSVARLEAQRARGSRFMIGDRLSALDIYSATSTAMIKPLPQDLCAMDHWLRITYTADDPQVVAAAKPILLEHRDFIYHEYLQLPMDF